MLEKIEHIQWNEDLESKGVSKTTIDIRNRYIDVYNKLPSWDKLKNIVGEYIYLIHPKQFWELIWIDLWVQFKEDMTIEDEERIVHISELLKRYSRKTNNILTRLGFEDEIW